MWKCAVSQNPAVLRWRVYSQVPSASTSAVAASSGQRPPPARGRCAVPAAQLLRGPGQRLPCRPLSVAAADCPARTPASKDVGKVVHKTAQEFGSYDDDTVYSGVVVSYNADALKWTVQYDHGAPLTTARREQCVLPWYRVRFLRERARRLVRCYEL
jgi:hypothetical protein